MAGLKKLITEVHPGDAQHWMANISRLKRLGYQSRLKLAEGLADTVHEVCLELQLQKV